MRRYGALGALATCATVAAFLPSVAGAAPQPASTSTTLAPGLTLTTVTDPSGPYQLRILTVDPTKPVTLDVATAGASLGTYALTSKIGTAKGALAAVNGDFSVAPGRPVHAMLSNGTFLQSGIHAGAAFSQSHDRVHAYLGAPHVSISGVAPSITGSNFSVSSWNSGQPTSGGIAAFTRYGGTDERPGPNECAVRLSAPTKLKWGNTTRTRLTRDYSVNSAGCSSAAMRFGSKGAVILTSDASGSGAIALEQLVAGSTVRLSWSDGWAGSMDAMGGQPLLLENGTIVAPQTCGSFCLRNPRTGVGTAPDGTVFIVTVDGRCTCSAGMTLVEFAKEFISLGATWAINLDGGGGTTMWIKGQGVVNQPSDTTGERPVTTALLVLPGSDPNEPTPGFALASGGPPETIAVSPALASQAGMLAASDPGSTGGLFQALRGGWLRPRG